MRNLMAVGSMWCLLIAVTSLHAQQIDVAFGGGSLVAPTTSKKGRINLSQAKLLQLDGQNNVDSTLAALSAVLGFDKVVNYELREENTQLPSPPPDVDVLIHTAMQQRPDLQALTYNQPTGSRKISPRSTRLAPTHH